MMGQIPTERVTPSRIFTSFDYTGPIQIATKKSRGSKHCKRKI